VTRPREARLLTYGRQCLDDDDKRAVLEVLDSDWLTQGPMVDRFEHALAGTFGVPHAVVVANGTAALHLAAIALGWGPGDVVIVPAITFLASANCAAYVGAEPYFVDIDPGTLTVDPNEVERHVQRLRAQGRRVRAVVGVDLAGHPADWPALRIIADRYELTLVDDACHAMGATYGEGTKVGSCAHPDVAVLSFHPVKHITTGEGGAMLTHDGRLAERVALLRSHGMVRGEQRVSAWEGPWHNDMVALGYNYRLTDIQCALGLSQLRKLGRFVAQRRQVAAWYGTRLDGDPVFHAPVTARWAEHAYHLYLVRTAFGEGPRSRGAFFARCLAGGVQLQVHYRPVPLNTFYRIRPGGEEALSRVPVSLQFYREAFSAPMYTQLSEDDVAHVVDTIRAAAHEAGRA
jgi:perosamine synthetase